MEAGRVWEQLYEKPSGTEIKNADLAEALRNGKFVFSEVELDVIRKNSPDLEYGVFIKVRKFSVTKSVHELVSFVSVHEPVSFG